MAQDFEKTKNDIPLDEDGMIVPEKMGASKDVANVPYPRLEVISGPQEGLVIPLKKGAQTIGRSRTQAQIHLEDSSLSRNHAKIVVDEGGITLQDLESRHGTFINGKKIEKLTDERLNHCDQIKVGLYILLLATRPVRDEELAAKVQTQKEIQTPPEGEKASPITPPASFVSKKGRADTPAGKKEIVESDKKLSQKEPIEKTEKESLDLKNGDDVEPEASDLKNEEEEGGKQTALVVHHQERKGEKSAGSRLGVIFLIICFLSGVAGVSYYFQYRYNPSEGKKDAVLTQGDKTDLVEPDESDENSKGTKETTHLQEGRLVLDPNDKEKGKITSDPMKEGVSEKGDTLLPRTFHAFLDIQSKPTSALIMFEGRELGDTPLKTDVDLEPGKEYVVTAEFDLKEIRDKYQQRLTIKADVRKEVFPLVFDARIGVVKIQRLPQDVQFYLEGYYEYDQQKANPVKLADIIYGKPIYVPFGHYLIELREKVRIGSSANSVDQIRYQRNFDINEQNRVLELSITEKDLQFFPARLQSVPSGATVFFDGEKVGVTPFVGDLPLGQHQIKMTEDGYFDYEFPIDMQINTLYEENIVLKTSKVGQLIHRARKFRQTGDLKGALEELVEALKLGGAQKEKAEVYLLLGDLYYLMGKLDQSSVYFNQAKMHEAFHYQALLGLAKVRHAEGNRNGSLTLLVEVLLNAGQDYDLKQSAQALFQKVVSTNSVIYISTTPGGASVTLNGQLVNQKTPVILSDLNLGTYRIEISKEGFRPVQIKKELRVSEFVPMIVELKSNKI